MLQLLDRTSELADLRFEAADTHRHLLARALPALWAAGLPGVLRWILRRLLRWRALRRGTLRRETIAVAEQVVEEALRRCGARGHGDGGRDRRHGGQPKRAAEHETRSTLMPDAQHRACCVQIVTDCPSKSLQILHFGAPNRTPSAASK